MQIDTVYHRRRRVKNTYDAYDSLATRYPPSGRQEGMFDEYWSNGITTHLNIQQEHVHSSQTPSFPDGDQTAGASSNLSLNNGGGGRRETNLALKSILAGSVSGAVSTLFFHPFDVLRTKMQSTASLITAESTAAVSAGASRAGVVSTPITSSTGPVAVLAHTFKNGGFRALYTGLKPVLVAQAGYKATVFTVNNLTKKFLLEWKTMEQYKIGNFVPYEITIADTFICGATGGAVNAAALVAPVEFVRNQQISHHSKISSLHGMSSKKLISSMKTPLDIFKKTVKQKGFLGLWQGTGVTVLRDSLGCGCFFVAFEVGKDRLAPFFGGRDSMGTIMASGALAGWGYWLCALPLDTMKTLIQTGAARSARDIIQSSVGKEGAMVTLKGLFRGWQLAFGRGAPAAAVTLGTYTAIYELCDRVIS